MLYFSFAILLLKISFGQQYSLVDHWQGQNFFNNFDFFTGADPTHGYVNYVDEQTASNNGYISAGSYNVYIGCDHTSVSGSDGRDSVRISSKKSYNNGLFYMQLEHMPIGCATWPAFWMVGPNWPNDGEIDIIEGVNEQVYNQMTLHTSNGCDMSSAPKNYTGYPATGSNGQPAYNCYVDAANQYSNQGCSIISKDSTSYGNGLNSAGGGLIITEVNDNIGIRIWWWPMKSIPYNIVNVTNPNPESFGVPVASFPFGSWCPSSHFTSLQLVYDLTFCGDWAGSVWDQGCSQSTGNSNCDNYVQYNPQQFANAYWIIDYIKVYQQ